MSGTEFLTGLGIITTIVTGLSALVGAIISLWSKARELFGLVASIDRRLDDHSRRISDVGRNVTQVALSVPVAEKVDNPPSV